MMLTVLLLLGLILLGAPQPAHAYIDPCAGGYIVQAIFGFLLSATVTLRSFFSARKKAKTFKAAANNVDAGGSKD